MDFEKYIWRGVFRNSAGRKKGSIHVRKKEGMKERKKFKNKKFISKKQITI